MARCKTFVIVLIKPTHYDDDGYPIQWWRSFIPSNSLACMYGIAQDAADRKILGDYVECSLLAYDEANTPIRPKKIIDRINDDGGEGVVCLVGVQSNQFPRAVDLAKPFIDAGVPVVLGGFHVAGCLSMLDEIPGEIVAAQKTGISIFAGEAEQRRFDRVLRDAYGGTLKSLYHFLDDMPDLRRQPIPVLPKEQVARTYRRYASFDLGRGCPFQCSFCTIINVQGRTSRFRTADDLEAIIRVNAKMGIHNFFLTDDNLARNRNWEAFFDRLIELREKENLMVRLQVQVDTMCHRIDGFIDKAVAAGVDQVFVGMESIDPDNLIATKKKQNKIFEYRKMFLEWKRYPVVIIAGYILGFPNDTKESILRDVEIIKRELPIDIIYFTNLTPLPGCEDHKTLLENGAWMDSDLNKYDLNHRVTHHDMMSDEDWDEAYRQVWERFYTYEHMERVLKRMVALGSNKKLTTVNRLIMYREFQRLYSVHPLEGGFLRRKYRDDRRPGLPRENALIFYRKYAAEILRATFCTARTYAWLRWKLYRAWRDPRRFEYMDTAIAPPTEEDFEKLEMFTSDGAKQALKMQRARQAKSAASKPDKNASAD